MASLATPSGGGKKSVDAEVALVPFIDLLLCCIMFLLVTAVWNQLGTMQAEQRIPGEAEETTLPPPEPPLVLQIRADGYVLSSSAGDRVEAGDATELSERLDDRRRIAPNERRIVVAPEDGVSYERIIATMDIATAAGFAEVSMTDGATL